MELEFGMYLLGSGLLMAVYLVIANLMYQYLKSINQLLIKASDFIDAGVKYMKARTRLTREDIKLLRKDNNNDYDNDRENNCEANDAACGSCDPNECDTDDTLVCDDCGKSFKRFDGCEVRIDDNDDDDDECGESTVSDDYKNKEEDDDEENRKNVDENNLRRRKKSKCVDSDGE